MDHKNYLCYPTLFLVQKMFCLDFILHSLCFGKDSSYFFSNSTDKLTLILDLFATQIDISNLLCGSKHNLYTIFVKIFQSYINIFLSRMSDFKNDFRSEKNIRKLLVFNPDYSDNIEDES